MARVGERRAILLLGALAVATAGALWLDAGVAHANCPASDPNCMGSGDTTPPANGGGSMDTQPASQPVTNSQQSTSGPEVNVATPQPEPQSQPQTRYQPRTYTPPARSAAPDVSGSSFVPAVPDTAPPEPPKPGPAVSLTGSDAPAPGAGTALIAGLPPAPDGGSNPSPLLPGLALLAGAAVLALPLGLAGARGAGGPASPAPTAPLSSSAPPAPADFYVYRSPLDNHFAVARLGEGGVVAEGFALVYGPDTYAGCWAYVAANSIDTGPYFHAAPPPLV
ncbi:MAG: hypothetical protein JO265_10100 [Acidimicrobiia bacterium]|nr:hypothetical protein [Acidimicrobiia bacterium]